MVKRKTRTRSPKGLRIIERDGHWHIHGSVTLHDGRTIRVRRSTGLSSTAPKTEAEHLKARVEAEVREAVITGKSPSVLFSRAAVEWIKSANPGPTDIQNAGKLGKFFGSLRVDQITPADWLGYMRKDHSKNKPSTIRRYAKTFLAVMNFACRNEWVENLPHFEMPKDDKQKKEKVQKYLFPEEIKLLFDCAAPHLKPLIAVYSTTGCRVSEIIYLGVRDFLLAPNRERVTLYDTKNGEKYTKPLHPWAGQVMRDWLRNRQTGAAFLTPQGKPYVKQEGRRGGQFKAAMDAAKERAAKELIKEGQKDRAEVMMKVTPHWLRHSFASLMMADGVPVRTIMEAGGWKSSRIVIETYGHLAPKEADKVVLDLPFHFETAETEKAIK